MKAIKKVEVVPLDYNIGKIINSATTTDDKTKNTYSMQVIDNIEGTLKTEINDVDDKADGIIQDLETNYLNKEDAADTYVTQTNASTTYKTKGDFAILTGNVDDVPGGQVSGVTVNLPSGFTRSNSFVIGRAWGEKGYVLNSIYGNEITSGSSRMDDYISIHFNSSSQLRIEFYNLRGSTVSFSYKILLMKI